MMKCSFKTAALLLVVSALFVVSCKKDKVSPTELLTAPSCWKMVLLEGFDSTNDLWVAVPLDACIADNCFTFNIDQSFATEEGASKCDPDDPQTADGTWSISEDGKRLSISEGGSSETGDIVELSATKLSYEAAFDSAKVRVTFQAH